MAKSRKKPPATLAQQLFCGVLAAMESGWSVNAISHAAGIPQASLQAWVNGSRESISLKTASALAMWLGMSLTEPVIPEHDD